MENKEETSYTIADNVISLILDGAEYSLTGSCSECVIEVGKITAQITLNSVSIESSSSDSGPFVISKEANIKLILVGESTIKDNGSKEGAGIKFKTGSILNISGEGVLNIISTAKNGIKGAKTSQLIIDSGTFNVECPNNGIAADGSVTINGGTFKINSSGGDGIKSDPDYGDNASEGIITINGGNFEINSYNDGFQARNKLIINDGTFNIKTFTDGASSTAFNKTLYSAKGLKVSSNETTDDTCLTITGGEFNLDTADDAIHSDGNIEIIRGTITISSGDDGIHADQNLTFGQKDDENDNEKLVIKISKSYEGLEGSQIYIYSGTYNIIASDDGINSAGDTSEECQANGAGRDNGGPGGNENNGQPGGPGDNNGQQGGNGGTPPDNNGDGNNPPEMPSGGSGRNLRGLNIRKLQFQPSQCNIFHINIFGGDI